MTIQNNMVFKEDGDILYGDDLMSNLSRSVVNSLNIFLDNSTLTTTNQSNFDNSQSKFDETLKSLVFKNIELLNNKK